MKDVSAEKIQHLFRIFQTLLKVLVFFLILHSLICSNIRHIPVKTGISLPRAGTMSFRLPSAVLPVVNRDRWGSFTPLELRRDLVRTLNLDLCRRRTLQETWRGDEQRGVSTGRRSAHPGAAGDQDLRGGFFREGAEQREEKHQGGLSITPTVLISHAPPARTPSSRCLE